MPEPFCQLEPESASARAFVQAVKSRNAVRLRQLLSENPELQRNIDQPWFAFDSPAIVAAKNARSVLEVLLEFGANINERSSWWAGSFGVLDGVEQQQAEFLISQGAILDMHVAAALGNRAIVAQMIEDDPKCVNCRGGDGQTPLHVARLEIVDLLLIHGADVDKRCLDHSATAAQYAVDNPPKCRRLLAAGAKPDIFMAVALGDRDLVDRIIESEPHALAMRVGSCPNTSPVDPRSDRHIYFWKLDSAVTPLEVAREFGQTEIYSKLLDCSAPPQKFLEACWTGNLKLASSNAELHPEIFQQLDETEQREMARAAWQGNLAAVETMLKFGFDPHLAGDEDSTPLDRAAFHGHSDIVSVLLQHDPSPPLEAKNAHGCTPLGCCVYGSKHSWKNNTDHVSTALALIKAGANIESLVAAAGKCGSG